MIQTKICVDMDSLREIESVLGMTKDKSRIILKTALNNAVRQVEGGMEEGTRKKYRFSKGKAQIRRANSVKKANVGMLSAELKARGPVNELLEYHVNPMLYLPGGGYPEWYKARVLRGGKLHKIALRPWAGGDQYKGFMIRYRSGHYALAQRIPGKRMRSKPGKEAVKSLLSISTPKAEEVVYREEIADEMYGILMKNIQEQMERFLG